MKQISILLVLALLAGCYGREPEKTGMEGKPFPEFSMQLSDSISYFNTISITAGKPSALFYFGPHCPYSRAQIEEIIEDMDRLKDIHFYLVTRSPLPAMRKFYEDYHLDKYPNISIGRDTAHFVADYFEIPGVPYMAMFDKEKLLRKAYLGKIYSSQILSAVKE